MKTNKHTHKKRISAAYISSKCHRQHVGRSCRLTFNNNTRNKTYFCMAESPVQKCCKLAHCLRNIFKMIFLFFSFLSLFFFLKRAQVTATFHQQQSIYPLWLLSSHSISHSVDYTPRGARPDNQAGNPILCHIKCQARSFRCRVITAGGDSGGRGEWWGGRWGGGHWRKGENEG